MLFTPQNEKDLIPKGSNDPLIDKVYTFNSSYDEFLFSLNLESKFDCYIYVETATPNNICNLAITTWDPDNNTFKIFQREMISDHHTGDYDEIPFGTALAILYKINLRFHSTELEL